jgi:hypothetical protein
MEAVISLAQVNSVFVHSILLEVTTFDKPVNTILNILHSAGTTACTVVPEGRQKHYTLIFVNEWCHNWGL